MSSTCEKKEWIAKLAEAGCDEAIFAWDRGVCGSLRAFSDHDLHECIEMAHAHGMKAAIQADRLFHDADLYVLSDTICLLAKEADYMLFSDPGIMSIDGMPVEKLICSPQTLMTSSPDALTWLQSGIASVVISPLLTEDELCRIVQACPSCTVPVHGYQKMSVSARHLLSAWNPAWKYRYDLSLQEETREETMPVYEDDYGTVIYTPEKLQSLRLLPKLKAERYLITTEWMSETEVMDTIKAYRAVIDDQDAQGIIQQYLEKYGNTCGEGYYGRETIL